MVVVVLVAAAAVGVAGRVTAIMVLVEVGAEAGGQDYGGYKPDFGGIEFYRSQSHLRHHSKVLVFHVPD